MEQFVYTDIFDTKGIEYIIVIAFLLMIIPFWRMMNRPLKTAAIVEGALEVLSLKSLRVPAGVMLNRNHTWSHLERNGLASVGMDDLLLNLTGGVELTYLKEVEENVNRGEAIARISQHGKELLITSPVSGKVKGLHRALEQDSGSIMEDPYNSWLLRIRPDSWQEETRNALLADKAQTWIGKELERFRDFLAETAAGKEGLAPVLQEGGELMAYPMKEMDQSAWKGFQEKFLQAGA